jgi:transcriptional regulator with XRE-family HTH domain
MLPKQFIFSGMAMDSPLRRWRRANRMTQRELAARCGVTFTTIARYEQALHFPAHAYLDRLIEVTGLPADALVRPRQFLAAHPDFLAEWAEDVPSRGRRGRPPKRSEEEGHP